MIVYGRFISPFVRRVLIWLNLQGREYQHQPIMVMGDDFSTLKSINPIGRVPAVRLPDGEVLVESSSITDWLEDEATRGQRMIPRTGADRRRTTAASWQRPGPATIWENMQTGSPGDAAENRVPA